MPLMKSLRPQERPETLDARAALSIPPSGPTPETVRVLATQESSLPGDTAIVLGIFGENERPCALIRLPDGTIDKVTVGSHIGAQMVIGVAEDAVTLTNSTRLHMPL